LTGDSNALNKETRVSPRFLVLAGTTAVGKTDVSVPLAKLLNGEIISADSRQIYRELNIGTAKPTDAQLAEVPHHFINEKSIRERWTAGDFGREGRQRIDDILERNRVPIVVGGSGLYLRALLDGFFDVDFEIPADYALLRQELDASGAEQLYEELRKCDPELASRTDPHDHHRILRGLAVYRTSGLQLSELQRRQSERISHAFQLYFLFADRSETYARVDMRAQTMVDLGLAEEVRAISELGFNETNCNALRTHGYQEVFPYLRGEISRQQVIEDIQKAVRHYVKRQLTWFRHEHRTIWVSRSFEESPEAVANRIFELYCSAQMNHARTKA
jgi:tRNA dimethylallyltransferase